MAFVVISLALLLVGGGTAAILLVQDEGADAEGEPLAAPSSAPPPHEAPPGNPPAAPPETGRQSDELFIPTVRTPGGNIFTRVATRTGDCTAAANEALKELLERYPCRTQSSGGLYRSPDQGKTYVLVTLMEFADTSAATAVNGQASAKKAVPTVPPPPGQAAAGTGGEVERYWASSWAQGDKVLFRQSFPADGDDAGPANGEVNRFGQELGTELNNVLRSRAETSVRPSPSPTA